MKFPNAPYAVRSTLEKLLDPERLLAGSVLVISITVGLTFIPGLFQKTSPIESVHIPQNAIAAIHSSVPLDYDSWKEVIDNFLPAESLDLFTSAAAKGAFSFAGPGEAKVIVFDGRVSGYTTVILIPGQGRGQIDAGLETAVAAAQAPLLPVIREVRLPDGTLSRVITQDPDLFHFETVAVAGKPARALRFSGGGLAYMTFNQTTAVAVNPETLVLLFDPPARDLLRLCPPGGFLTVFLRAKSWPSVPEAVLEPLLSPFFFGFPPLIYVPSTSYVIHTPNRSLTLPICPF